MTELAFRSAALAAAIRAREIGCREVLFAGLPEDAYRGFVAPPGFV
jgi:hypothetical protein